jgi:hypothetical protein
MLIYQEFLALNEELPAFDPNERLRFAVHEIMVRLKDGQNINYSDVCNILKEEFKIDISEEILAEILERWDRYNDPDYTVFKKDDKNWMDVWKTQKYIKRKCRDKQSFGKHRKKDTTYTTGRRDTYWNGYAWVPYGTTPGRGDMGDWRYNEYD